jgi:hypothetical protein
MNWIWFGRITAWAGIAGFALAASPLLAAPAPESAAATSARHDATCANTDYFSRPLVMIDNSGGSFQCLGLVLDGDAITAIRVETHRFESRRGRADAEQVDRAEFSIGVLEGSQGAVLDGVPGHDALILQGHISAVPGETSLVTSYLYNGFTGEYRSCRIRLERLPGSGWRLADRFDRTISHIVVKTRRIPLIGMFGIDTLEGACA